MDLQGVSTEIISAYQYVSSLLPLSLRGFANLFFVVILMVIYSVFVWKLQKFIGTKNILKLNLHKYNTADHPVLDKLFAVLLYMAEYLVIFPILIFIWFAIFALFLIFVMELEVATIFFISAAVIATIRITAYIPKYGRDLSMEIAKLLPLNLLAITLLTPGFFDIERIIGNLSHVNDFFGIAIPYIVLIVGIEVFLRFFELIFGLFGIEDEEYEEEEVVKKK